MTDAIEALRTTLDNLRDTRQTEAPKIASAIRMLEAAMRGALEGHVLKGMPNLGDRCGLRIYGLNVRAPVGRRDKVRYPDLGDSKRVLVLRPDGSLVAIELTTTLDAERYEVITMNIEAVGDNEFMPSDLRAVIETFEEAIQLHFARVDRTQAQWAAAGKLADRLIQLLAE
jgi:hypothetical protein